MKRSARKRFAGWDRLNGLRVRRWRNDHHPKGLRLHIGFFGRRNVGKSSLLNAITRQQVSIVSEVAGTTTDPVEKPMELLPLDRCSSSIQPASTKKEASAHCALRKHGRRWSGLRLPRWWLSRAFGARLKRTVKRL